MRKRERERERERESQRRERVRERERRVWGEGDPEIQCERYRRDEVEEGESGMEEGERQRE